MLSSNAQSPRLAFEGHDWRSSRCSGLPGGNSAPRPFPLPILRGRSIPLWTEFSWCVPEGWNSGSFFLRGLVTPHFLPPPPFLGALEVRGHRTVGWQEEAVRRMGPGSRAASCFACLVCLIPSLVPGQTTTAFLPSLWANCCHCVLGTLTWDLRPLRQEPQQTAG